MENHFEQLENDRNQKAISESSRILEANRVHNIEIYSSAGANPSSYFNESQTDLLRQFVEYKKSKPSQTYDRTLEIGRPSISTALGYFRFDSTPRDLKKYEKKHPRKILWRGDCIQIGRVHVEPWVNVEQNLGWDAEKVAFTSTDAREPRLYICFDGLLRTQRPSSLYEVPRQFGDKHWKAVEGLGSLPSQKYIDYVLGGASVQLQTGDFDYYTEYGSGPGNDSSHEKFRPSSFIEILNKLA